MLSVLTNVREYLSSTRYCFGVGITVRLVPFKTLDSIVLCHPSALTEASIKAVDVGVYLGLIHLCNLSTSLFQIPAARACAERWSKVVRSDLP
jgi:hypothetical protein